MTNIGSTPSVDEQLTLAWTHVRGLMPTSMCDWPGMISTVVFLGGCNFKCPTCHNADMAWRWKQLPSFDRSLVLAGLRQRSRWIDGITVTGGEPTCTPSLEALLADIGTVGLPIKLDSNGANPKTLRSLLEKGLVHTIAVDIKGPWRLYPELTGGSMAPEKAMESLTSVFAIARDFPGKVYFRCTKVPALTADDLIEVSRQVPTGETLIFQDFIPPKQG